MKEADVTGDPNQKHRVYLVDGSGYIFRAYFAMIRGRGPITRSDGTPTGAVLGFSNMLFKLIQDTQRDDRVSHLAVIFDTSRKTFRTDIYPEYKANRDAPPEDLIPQFPLVREATRAFNVPAIEKAGYEADDIIATYARQAREQDMECVIVSSDKDLMQLVGGPVTMLDPMKNKPVAEDEVFEKFGAGPDKVVDIQALAGDSVDNVPGVPGIGIKTAALLINEYGDLDTLLERAGEIKQKGRREKLLEHADKARISRELVRLKDDVELDIPVTDLNIKDPVIEELTSFIKENEFRQLSSRIASFYGPDFAVTIPASPAKQSVKEEAAAASNIDLSSVEKKYSTVTTEADLDKWIAKARKIGTLAIDTETTSLHAMEAELVGISLSVEPGEACYIPVGHVGPKVQGGFDFGDGGEVTTDDGKPDQLDKALVIEKLKPLLADPTVLKVGQNIKYDMTVLANEGVVLHPVDDTMLLSYCLDAGLHGHGMDELSRLHFDISPIPYKEVAGTGKSQISFAEVPIEKASEYAAEDADITLRLHKTLRPQLFRKKVTTLYDTIERPLVPVIADMEQAGIKVDAAFLSHLSEDFGARMDGFVKEIHELAGEEFNVGSPKQLGEILFDKMEIPGGKKGKNGAYTTDVNVLEGLAADGVELAAKVLEWRQLSKLKSTYTDALQAQINSKTGRIHTSFSLAAAATGRLASSEPNLQNIPIRTEEGRKLRQAFIAKEGCKLISADYSQIELRILAHMANIESLQQAFADGIDIHAKTASQVFGVPLEGMDPMMRRSAKAINFGIIYGISAFGLARQLDVSRTQAQGYIDAYFEQYPGIRKYMEETKAFAKEHGYVETLFGRRVHLPGMQDTNGARRSFSERAAINAPIQGSAADIIKRAMIRLPDALKNANLKAKMLLQVHDELIFEVPENEADATIKVIKDIMENAASPAIDMAVPLIVDADVGDNWGEAH
ncbi:DNA polymerase I [Sneathiella sp. P13V-1]|uniref:DNA polymerase I n=1 Tax=Sneathiella sp. P13V-1 TaxID=2697366 RepID=UPI00187B16E0|nr:DNA polymerase I [Sneathiella sp. P13V-1]MBE7635971.1 DNA polymerase I [Sneathiella sp. P13V-1]